MTHDLQFILTSEPLSRRLYENGLRVSSCFWYQPYYETMAVVGMEVKQEDKRRRILIVGQKPTIGVGEQGKDEESAMLPVSALTVVEIGRIMPPVILNSDPKHKIHELTIKHREDFAWNVAYICTQCGGALFETSGPILTECMGEALDYLLVKKLLVVLPVKH